MPEEPYEEHIEQPEGPSGQEQELLPEPTEAELLQQKIQDLENTIAQVKDQLLRKAAEFENYRKRTSAEQIERVRLANENLIVEIIPVIDDVERSLKMSKGKQEFDVLYRGVELILQKLQKVLEAQGLKSYDALGKPFDTELHEAMMQLPKPGAAPNTVIEEVERGYKLHDKVVRHAKVVVAGETDSTGASGSSARDGASTGPSEAIS